MSGDDDQLFVGESFYQSALLALLAGRGHTKTDVSSARKPIRESFTARLIPEINNPHDANAVAVQINGRQVAHLSRSNAANYRRAFGTKVGDVPVEIWVKAGGNGIVSVWPAS